MPLEGNIKEFGLADVIQFICNNQKDGVLLLEAKTDTASISFEQGKITGALYGRKGKNDQLTNYLQRSKRIDAETVQRMLRLAADSGLTMDEVMVKEGVMTGEEIQSIIAFKIQEVFDEIFTLTDANYRFDADAKLYKKSKYQVALGPDMLLLEAMRRKDEWPTIAKALPKDAIELVKTAKDVPPPDQGTDDFMVWLLLDQPRSVAALIDETGLGRFRTFNACYNLLQAKSVITTGQEAALLRAQEQAGPGAMHYVGRSAVAIATIGACLALLAGAFSLGRALTQRGGPGGPNAVRNMAVTLQRETLEQQIEVFRLINGRPPRTLREAGAALGMINNFAYSVNDSTGAFTLEVRK
ncbi:MAG TPA: DUF4388 domain-containing protein [Candidatus Edwardsbacteria bacterium]|nr:DUF4388 domain-containing protein [Candidatus Edwardsbacteria bacterium]